MHRKKISNDDDGVKEQIEQMSINGSGIRETVRVLNVSINTVLSTLKKFPEMQRQVISIELNL